MRFQQALLLQKQQVEQADRREERDRLFNPVKEAVNQQYVVTKAWFDPLTKSLDRVRIHHREQTLAALRNAHTSTPSAHPIPSSASTTAPSSSSSSSHASHPSPSHHAAHPQQPQPAANGFPTTPGPPSSAPIGTPMANRRGGGGDGGDDQQVVGAPGGKGLGGGKGAHA
ncbi:hypothetical protein HDV00_002046 [Rhizophlyctis rosea]|nr:hypothetical protein HDV00_002046 [Rhizophlyctis rosea]